MSNGHGGSRPNAGRKRKPLADKILEANNGNREIKKLKRGKIGDNITELKGEEMPQPAEYLSRNTKNMEEKLAVQIFENTWRWLKERGCEGFVVKELIEQYAINLARSIQCENAVDMFGMLAKHPTTGMPQASPFTSLGITYAKQANVYWGQIFQIVKENSSVVVDKRNPNDDMMERILSTPSKRN
jgi:hypothetical protein